MNSLFHKAIADLEFTTVCEQIALLCHTEKGRDLVKDLPIYFSESEVFQALSYSSEYLSSFDNENRIPNHGFEPINEELSLLRIENTAIEPEGFQRIAQVCELFEAHHKFFKKFNDYYPTLSARLDALVYQPEIKKQIALVIDRFGVIKSNASPVLIDLRRSINEVRSKINQSFGAALNQYTKLDYLDEIRESVIENQRVLAVKSMYRRKVKGSLLGNSKTGSIVYILPESTQKYSRDLADLVYEETQEIRRILVELTNFIRPSKRDIELYVDYLVHTDVIAAKAKYGQKIGGIMPTLNNGRRLFLKDAYHPLLLLQNKKENRLTKPQTIELHPENRIIVISGPNSGGKSITLKTVGLLQLMLQAGVLIPVHRASTVCLFENFLTDIGDNQSIENHLSTYSYRLKNMRQFLHKCDDTTLFLIDEFGTGSDPELGGALAEVFLEEFYERLAYGVITTHYSNLKLLANELAHATNANMLFDNSSLEPTYQLVLGEAGSSFTFEVAEKNGIPYRFLNRAKKKIEGGKVRFDQTIAKLQKERSKMTKTESVLEEQSKRAKSEAEKLEKLNEKLDDKLKNYQQLYDYHQRMIQLGQKLDELSEGYFVDQKKRNLIGSLIHLVETENSKRKKKNVETVKNERKSKQAQESELKDDLKTLPVTKNAVVKKKVKAKPDISSFKVGDKVRLEDSKSTGTIDTIEKEIATVNYGMFTTKVHLSKLEKR
ncbi:MAG: DNA mismatch repair protein MutS [Bacteroidetes bacterium]|nr:DNA mismatch repair protein MutS [Bacteroidota bacterium]